MQAEPRCRPISFVDQLVQRILAGEKTQTRRLAQFEPLQGANLAFSGLEPGHYCTGVPSSGWVLYSRGAGACWNQRTERLFCPYGQTGERLWVRESYQFVPQPRLGRPLADQRIRYLADRSEQWVRLTEPELAKLRARKRRRDAPTPGRFLYRSCARLYLRVESIRVERLQDITEDEALAEGVCDHAGPGLCRASAQSLTHRDLFASLWDSINGERPGASWEANPWVWAVGFSVASVLVRRAA